MFDALVIYNATIMAQAPHVIAQFSGAALRENGGKEKGNGRGTFVGWDRHQTNVCWLVCAGYSPAYEPSIRLDGDFDILAPRLLRGLGGRSFRTDRGGSQYQSC